MTATPYSSSSPQKRRHESLNHLSLTTPTRRKAIFPLATTRKDSADKGKSFRLGPVATPAQSP